jgi:hypothetical protein
MEISNNPNIPNNPNNNNSHISNHTNIENITNHNDKPPSTSNISTINIYDINDTRTNFKVLSFCNYKVNDVKRELVNNLYQGVVESSCRWSAELICSGLINDVWDIFIYFFAKHIYTSHIKLAVYLSTRLLLFKNTMATEQKNMMLLRNNQTIRKLTSEISTVLALSPKSHVFNVTKIKQIEFDLTKLTDKLKAPNTTFALNVMKETDPDELIIPINEFAFSLTSEGSNTILSTFWFEWAMSYLKKCKKKNNILKCEIRAYLDDTIHIQSSSDIIWIFWDAIMYESNKRNEITKKIINSLRNIFMFNYSTCRLTKRKMIIYLCIEILTKNYQLLEKIINNEKILELAINNINILYVEIKQHGEQVDKRLEYI